MVADVGNRETFEEAKPPKFRKRHVTLERSLEVKTQRRMDKMDPSMTHEQKGIKLLQNMSKRVTSKKAL